MKTEMRAGIGFDVHPLVPGRRLVLGGVDIPFDMGLSGWSDADVLIHAIIDALLGAAGLGDIGIHFPPDAPQYRDISSLVLLETVKAKLMEKKCRIVNIDAVIMAEQPKLKGFFPMMQRQVSQALGIEMERVNIKAATSEGLGYIGRGEGMSAWAVALAERPVSQGD